MGMQIAGWIHGWVYAWVSVRIHGLKDIFFRLVVRHIKIHDYSRKPLLNFGWRYFFNPSINLLSYLYSIHSDKKKIDTGKCTLYMVLYCLKPSTVLNLVKTVQSSQGWYLMYLLSSPGLLCLLNYQHLWAVSTKEKPCQALLRQHDLGSMKYQLTLPQRPILGSSNSAANKDMMS